jgi:RHS repeat-associated protein
VVLLEPYNYVYDGNERLKSVQGLFGETIEQFGYDDSDNLLQQTRSSGTWTASPNDNNQLALVNGITWSYDLAGNLVDDGQRTYTWDAEQRLVKITRNDTGATSEFTYDGLGRRVSVTERATPTAAAVTTYYAWCGGEVCQKRDATQLVTATYLRQGEMQGTTPLYYNRDQLGSPREVFNQAGAAVGTMRYGAYGRTVDSNGTLPDKRYAGMLLHKESGLYLTWYRAYDPDAGRWLSRDPIGETGGDNLYAYVSGNPISRIDPLGLKEYTECEVRGILNGVIQEMSIWQPMVNAPPRMALMLWNHTGKYDYKYEAPNDTFQISGTSLNAAQFGNFIAGYAGTYYGPFGYTGVRAAGIAFDYIDGNRDWDRDSVGDIDAGAAMAEKELDSGKLNTCGCR